MHVGIAGCEPQLLEKRREDPGQVCTRFLLRAPDVGDDKAVGGWIDDMGEQARGWPSSPHHRLTDVVVQLVELLVGCPSDCEL